MVEIRKDLRLLDIMLFPLVLEEVILVPREAIDIRLCV
jgi:hypothetical protein